MSFGSRGIRTLRLTYSVGLKILMILPYMMMYFQLEGHNIDRFACDYNIKLPRFNSRFLQPKSDWGSKCFLSELVVWKQLVSTATPRLSEKCWHTCVIVERSGLVVPMRKSAYYCTLLCGDGVHLNSFVKDWLLLRQTKNNFFRQWWPFLSVNIEETKYLSF